MEKKSKKMDPSEKLKAMDAVVKQTTSKKQSLHVREYTDDNGNLIVRLTLRNNRLHDADATQPAIQYFYSNLTTKGYEFWQHGVAHKEDGPQFELIYPDGKVKERKWIVKGKLHRKGDLPASVRYYKNGNAEVIRFWQNDKPHRPHKKGPAYTKFREDGTKEIEMYIEKDKLHRPISAGPALIKYAKDGITPEEQEYHVQGKWVDENGTPKTTK